MAAQHHQHHPQHHHLFLQQQQHLQQQQQQQQQQMQHQQQQQYALHQHPSQPHPQPQHVQSQQEATSTPGPAQPPSHAPSAGAPASAASTPAARSTPSNSLAPPPSGRTTAATLMREGFREFTVIKEVGDGSFGTVCLADWQSPLPSGTMLSPMQHPTTRPEYIGKRLVAIKRMKKPFQNWEECMHLKELKSLLAIPHHPNIIPLYDAFLMPTSKELHFVFECMEGNLYQLTKSRRGRQLAGGLVASIFEQMLQGLHHIHQHGYFHRDMKPENLLITTTGLADYPPSTPFALPSLPSQNGASPNQPPPERDVLVIVKLADFGLARETASVPPYTEYVSTRWYRAPEVLLRSRDYSNPVDMWALGTILAELVNLRPLFPGQSEVDQVLQIGELLGDPSPDYGTDERGRVRGGGAWDQGIRLARAVGFTFRKMMPIKFSTLFGPRVPSSLIDCIQDLLRYDPAARPTTQQCIDHVYFKRDAPRLKPPRPKPVIPSVGTQSADTPKTSSLAPSSQQQASASSSFTASAHTPATATNATSTPPVRTNLPPRANLVPLPANIPVRAVPPSHSNQTPVPRPPFASDDPQRILLPNSNQNPTASAAAAGAAAGLPPHVNLQPLSASAAAQLQAQAQAHAQAQAQAQKAHGAQSQAQGSNHQNHPIILPPLQPSHQSQQHFAGEAGPSAAAEGAPAHRVPFYEQQQVIQPSTNILPKIAIPPVSNLVPGLGPATPKAVGDDAYRLYQQQQQQSSQQHAGSREDLAMEQQQQQWYQQQQALYRQQQQQQTQQQQHMPYQMQGQQYSMSEEAMSASAAANVGPKDAGTAVDPTRRKSKGWGVGPFNLFNNNSNATTTSLPSMSSQAQQQQYQQQSGGPLAPIRRPTLMQDVQMTDASTQPVMAVGSSSATLSSSNSTSVATSASTGNTTPTASTPAQASAAPVDSKKAKKAEKEAAIARRMEQQKAYQERARAVMLKRKQMLAASPVGVSASTKDEVEWLSSDGPPQAGAFGPGGANSGAAGGGAAKSEVAKGKQPMVVPLSMGGVPVFGGHSQYAGHPIPQNFGSASMFNGGAGHGPGVPMGMMSVGGQAGSGGSLVYGGPMGWQARNAGHTRMARPHQRMMSLEYDEGVGPSRMSGSGAGGGGGGNMGSNVSGIPSYMAEDITADHQRRMSVQTFQTGDSDPGPAPQQMHGPTTQFLQRSNTATSLNSLAPSFANMNVPHMHAGSSAHGGGSAGGSSLDHQLIADMGNMTAQDARLQSSSPGPHSLQFVEGRSGGTGMGSRGNSYSGARSRTGSRASSHNHRQGSASPLHVQPAPRFHPYSHGGEEGRSHHRGGGTAASGHSAHSAGGGRV